MTLINKNFMINNEYGVRLYNDIAKDLPIIDYHCHLDAKEIYENRSFANMSELWLAGDHYKWRAMRANGIDERCITGEATAEEKFQAWAETVEACFGNPLYHWTHLELQAYFDCEEALNSRNWREIMQHCNAQLQKQAFTPRQLILRSNVEVICTTDSPLDDLHYHQLLNEDETFPVKVLPTFRPDGFFEEEPRAFSLFMDRLAATTHLSIETLDDFDKALAARIAYFHDAGCRISDHGLLAILWHDVAQEEAERLFRLKRRGAALTAGEQNALNSTLFKMLARHYKQHEWAMQIHFGAIRNNNSRMFAQLGINTGFDSIADQPELAANLNQFLDGLARDNALPKTIIYNLNASYNDVVASTIANFQSAALGVKSPIQFGSGWWFNDTRRGMENQLNALADQGLLMNFVGMLTDSRSLVSYPRHDYFRRIVCNLIGGWVSRGEVPDDQIILSRMVKNICHDNAQAYFKF
ncbi:glucuronate isomerase [Raoultella sp. BIGb0138]|uniref:glucuronate isomerase n=1 Tax=Raoultella sp. BIGb0138 TaxID=2485115 RepID=UPI0010436A41|nr:glucuronate isomerase [Raoultella sp. BIGb0138]TCW08639.1 glucuronate isomerase [Raoultella sp. BIGb0138]